MYMNHGQTSLILFLSKLTTSALGFLATLYFARELGAEVLGVYALVLTVVGWLFLFIDLGVGQALIKRVSEENEESEYLAAAIIWVLLLALCLFTIILIGRPILESYVSEFDQYSAFSVIWFIIPYILAKSFATIVSYVIEGERKVHITGLIDFFNFGGRSVLQIVLVFLGFGLSGMIAGSIVGSILAGIAGMVWMTVLPARPTKQHFRSLYNYAKFSWISNLQTRAFNEVDILLLGVFVETSLVGVYSIAWSLSKFLDLFGTAIRSTLFPEISNISAGKSDQAAAGLIEDSLAYTGLIATPGLIGSVVLGERLLMIYGKEFTNGATVLGYLILAVLLFSYQKQLMGALNGLNYPNIAFRVNAVFIAANTALNLIFIPQYGIKGAAAASVLSTGFSLGLAYLMLSQLIAFAFPYAQIARQWVAALAMGVSILAIQAGIENTSILNNDAVIVTSLVCFGAGVYFLSLLAISREFRATASRNIPMTYDF
jgi:O-antigen/teichoic acid export membrane protein